jgi:hypothetical protein
MMPDEKSAGGRSNRREFLYKLGIGTAITISGYYLIDSLPETEKASFSGDKPMLKKDIVTYRENTNLFLVHKEAKYCVNQVGADVVGLLDGEHSVTGISHKIGRHYGIGDTAGMECAISKFICELGSAGFLVSPYYATIFENYE